MEPLTPETYFSPRQVAERLSLSKAYILKLIRAGTLEAVQPPGTRRYLVPEAAVRAFTETFTPVRPGGTEDAPRAVQEDGEQTTALRSRRPGGERGPTTHRMALPNQSA
jgi:excisionase family DNA binding protein